MKEIVIIACAVVLLGGLVAILIYSIRLQRRAVGTQGEAMVSLEDSLESQKSALESQEKALQMGEQGLVTARETNQLLTEIRDLLKASR